MTAQATKHYTSMTNNYLVALVATYRDRFDWNEDLEALYNALLALPGQDKASTEDICAFNHIKTDMLQVLDNYKTTGIMVETY